MTCCSTFSSEARQQFTAARAARDLARYGRKGADVTTRMLRDLVMEATPAGATLLDIGAGVGVLTFELLRAGFHRAIAVDASGAYAAAGREETARRGLEGLVDWREGDFVALAPELPAADVVTLDRVVCCYPSWRDLLTSACDRAGREVACSYPRDRAIVRAVVAAENVVRRLRGTAFRTFVHPPSAMRALVERRGFRLAGQRATFAWRADVFLRST